MITSMSIILCRVGEVNERVMDKQRDQIWRNSLSNFLDGLFCIWQTFVPTLTFFATGQNFIGVNGQRLNSNIAVCSNCRTSCNFITAKHLQAEVESDYIMVLLKFANKRCSNLVQECLKWFALIIGYFSVRPSIRSDGASGVARRIRFRWRSALHGANDTSGMVVGVHHRGSDQYNFL